MEIIYDLNEDIWSRGDPNETTGYQTYRLMKCEKTETPGHFIYAVFDEQGFLKRVVLDGGAGCRDPLTGVSNIQLKLSPDEKKIEAIIVEDDCVKLKEEPPKVIANGGDDTAETADGETKEKSDTEDVKEASTDTSANAGDDDVTAATPGEGEQTEQAEAVEPSDENTPDDATAENTDTAEKSEDATDKTDADDNVSDQNIDATDQPELST